MRSSLISDPMEHFSKLIFVREILIHEPYESGGNSDTDIEELFSSPWYIYYKWHILFLGFKSVAKYDVLERGFSKRLETKATSFGLFGRKYRRTKIGSCSCGCKLGESKTDKAFTQINIINILCKKPRKPADEYFQKARETPGKFVALVIVLRFLLAN